MPKFTYPLKDCYNDDEYYESDHYDDDNEYSLEHDNYEEENDNEYDDSEAEDGNHQLIKDITCSDKIMKICLFQ